MKRIMLLLLLALTGSSARGGACDDYSHAVDRFIQSIRHCGKKLDQATDAHEFAEALNLFTSATEELTATLGQLTPQVTTLYQNHSVGSLPDCDRAQERLVAFASDLNAIGTKFAEQAQKYISDTEVRQALERLRKIRFQSSAARPARCILPESRTG